MKKREKIKKPIFILNFLFLFSLIISLNNLSGLICEINDKNTCSINSGYPLMEISSNENAHGARINSNIYDNVLCCYFGLGDTTCNGLNKVVGLSSSKNAHSEIPEESNYVGNDICYENLECISLMNNCNSAYDIEMISLDSDTNAHIGEFNKYPIKICCKKPIQTVPIGYWTDNNKNAINKIEIIPDIDSVKMILKDTGLPSGTNVIFDIYEDDLFFDDHILTTNGLIESDGSASKEWTISQINLDDANENEPYHFYFEVKSNGLNIKSGILEVTTKSNQLIIIDFCSDYNDSLDCENDIYNVANYSAQFVDPSLICGLITQDALGCDVWTNCYCKWDYTGNYCYSYTEANQNCPTGPGPIEGVGICKRVEKSIGDNCDDGLLHYEIVATWSWDPSNIGMVSDPNSNDYLKYTDGLWYYDPTNQSGKCIDESLVRDCPKQINLPFFEINHLLISLLVLIIIYIILKNKKIILKKIKR
jgi:hypothetical protein